MLIGRAYSAAIERKAGKDFNIDSLVEALIVSDIDQMISKLSEINRPSFDNAHEICRYHAVVTQIFKKFTNLDKRSLASKYLHFHAPKSVFIYDQIAVRALSKEVKSGKKSFNKLNFDYLDCDVSYANFFLRCIKFRDAKEQEIGQLITPRKLDGMLLNYSTGATPCHA
ncbi:hypothetical protein [Asticcacaulis endophyticus]|uniref:hypothetical protein n=1 Tax=Asticcacaulis endophyticus TaxID=1395890 RepID=UPI0016734168|nr:hypothetical protein [Asticcacaulis endophyticus]